MSALETGTYHILWRDSVLQGNEEAWMGDVSICDQGKADVRKLPILPYRPSKRIFKPQDYMEVYIAPATTDADTIVTADSYVRIPITEKNLRTGSKTPMFITAGKNVGSKYAFTDDAVMTLTATVGELKRIWYFKVPDGIELVLGHIVAFNSRVLVAPYDDGV